jgi:hypothetical protein
MVAEVETVEKDVDQVAVAEVLVVILLVQVHLLVLHGQLLVHMD